MLRLVPLRAFLLFAHSPSRSPYASAASSAFVLARRHGTPGMLTRTRAGGRRRAAAAPLDSAPANKEPATPGKKSPRSSPAKTPRSSPAKSPRPSPAKSPRSSPASPTAGPAALRSADLAGISPSRPWLDLAVPPAELRPSATLTTGQSFSWIPVSRDGEGAAGGAAASAWGAHDGSEWVGPLTLPVGDALSVTWVLSVREEPDTTRVRVLHEAPSDAALFARAGDGDALVVAALRAYFQLDVSLAALYAEWTAVDRGAGGEGCGRLARVAACLPGVRILRQEPAECLFSFICSSNNNIPRITLILANIRAAYGTELLALPRKNNDGTKAPPLVLHSFPTLEALHGASEDDLRALGLGYRAKFVVNTCTQLRAAGGYAHLLALRAVDDPTKVQEALTLFPGVGRKVADCVALFSLDQTDAIPVDTHVHQIAVRDYDRSLADDTVKSLTPAIYRRVGDVFRSRFPRYAGWAHSLLFVAELPSFRGVLPHDILEEMDQWKKLEKEKKKQAKKQPSPPKKKQPSPPPKK